MMTDINIHIVGIGNLGMSFLEGFKSLKDGTSFYLYENNKEIIKNLESSYSVTTDIDQIDNGVLLLCIKPNNLNEFINVNKSKISDQVLIATPLAGVSINHFENHFKNKVLRLMPNLAIKNNSGFIPYAKNYDEYINRSPIKQVKKIKKPILLFHGKKDTVISYKQTLKIQEILIHNNKYSEVIFFENEGHGFKNIENKKLVMQKSQEFLKNALNI